MTTDSARAHYAASRDVNAWIDRSIMQDEIVGVDRDHWTGRHVDVLYAICTDNADLDVGLEFWGETNDGDYWRVHLSRTPVTPADGGAS